MEASSKIIPIILYGQGVCGLLQPSLLALEGARWIGVNGGAAAAMPWCPAIRAADELRRCVMRIAMLIVLCVSRRGRLARSATHA